MFCFNMEGMGRTFKIQFVLLNRIDVENVWKILFIIILFFIVRSRTIVLGCPYLNNFLDIN